MRANWYFTAVGFLISTLYIVLQTLFILNLQAGISGGQIRFRIDKFGNAKMPELVGTSHYSLDQKDQIEK